MFPFLPWLYILVGVGIYQIIKQHRNAYILILPFIVTSIIQTPQKMAHYWSINWHSSDKNLFLNYKVLKNAVPSNELCIIVNNSKEANCVFSYKIDKMGCIFRGDYLPAGWVEDMIKSRGINYMYSNSEKINTDKEILQYVKDTILEVGDIKVFRLELPVNK